MPLALDVDLPFVQDAQIVIDAQADEAAWAQALVVDDWVTYYPVSGQEPAAHAEGRLLVDDQAIYLHCRVFDPEPARVRARITRRDGIWGDDWLGLYLDPSGEAQRAYLFLVNPFGVQADATRMGRPVAERRPAHRRRLPGRAPHPLAHRAPPGGARAGGGQPAAGHGAHWRAGLLASA